ncbi:MULTISPECIES: energy transducer TonB [Lysobacter]|uniref:TonB family protein n=1 Tax=Lysobacter yananisis TaxID=1003114 RepID=A0ABY9P6E1_9GAMM|nr:MULTISPECIES: energy transducer TonB [Lysobacter]QQQ03016.1 energy transducer TonB [Lysobacter enzymogenes]WMT01422.1 TonB family protein [Lysobacter yananisis]
MVRTLPSHHAHESLDGTRIAANAGAIAFNAAMLMLMLAPLSAPQLIQKSLDPVTDVILLPREKKPVVIEHKPPPVIRQVETKPQPRTPPVVQQQAPPQEIVVDQPALPMDFQGVEQVAIATPPSTNVGRGIIEGATLQVLRNPAPTYPVDAIRNNLTGTVELEILVGIDGKPLDVSIVRSSGHRSLDQAARKVVLQRWTFQPAMENGQAVQARGRVPIQFKLDQ